MKTTAVAERPTPQSRPTILVRTKFSMVRFLGLLCIACGLLGLIKGVEATYTPPTTWAERGMLLLIGVGSWLASWRQDVQEL